MVASSLSMAAGVALAGYAGGAAGGWRLPDLLRADAAGVEAAAAPAPAPRAGAPTRPAAKPGREAPEVKDPPAASAPSPDREPVPEGADPLVYVTTVGSAYHRRGCDALGADQLALPLGDARASYTPCTVCRPPR